MKKFLTFALAAALCTPVFAQKTGSSNSNAPTVEQTISAGGAKMTLNYTSITWASGKTLETAMDKENGAGTRDYINGQATKKPLAMFSTTVAVTCGDLKLEAGDYKVYYTISEACEWQINFAGKDDKVATMKLPPVTAKAQASTSRSARRCACSTSSPPRPTRSSPARASSGELSRRE